MKRAVGQERLDGFAIEAYEGKFAPKKFDVSDEMGQRLAVGDEILLVAQCRLKPPAFAEDSEGDLKRIEIFEPSEVTIIADADTWDKIEAIVGVVGNSGQARLFNPLNTEAPAEEYVVNVDEETGEIILANPPTTSDDEEVNVDDMTVEQLAVHERARARAFEGDFLDDEVARNDNVERFGETPINKDPVLRRFLLDDRA